MQEWVKLTPEQRQAARSEYKEFNKLSAEKRARIKAQYQQSLVNKPQNSTSQPATQ